MALFDIENPNTGAVITVEHDQAPTQDEAAAIIAQTSAPAAAIPVQPTAEQAFAKKYTAEQQQPLLSKVGNIASIGPNLIASLVEQAVKGAQGAGELLGAGTVNRREATRNAYQTGLEALARPTYDVLNAVRQAIRYGADNPTSVGTAMRAVTNPLGSIAPLIQSLQARTPSSDEVSQVFKRELENKAFDEVRETPIAPEIFGKANIPLAEALPLVPVVPGAAGVAVKIGTKAAKGVGATAAKVASRGLFKAPLEDVVTKTLGITAQEGSGELVPVLKSRILEATGKAPTNAAQAIAAAGKTEDFLINKTVDALKVADQQGLQMSKQAMLQNAEDAIRKAQPTIPQAEVDAALQPFRDRLPDTITPSQGQKLLVEQNNFLDSVFGDTGIPARKTKGNASVTARLGIADSMSNQLDDLYRAASGLDESPYRDWGQVRDAKTGLNEQIISAQRTQAGKVPGGKGVPVTKTGLGSKALKTMARPFVPREIEAIDNGVQRIFKDAQGTPAPGPIDPAAQQALIQKYTPQPPTTPPAPPPVGPAPAPVGPAPAPVAPAPQAATIPPATLQAIITQSLARPPVAAVAPSQLSGVITRGAAPVVAPVAVANDLETAIQAAINNLPREYNGLTPEVKRRIAIQVVEGNTQPAQQALVKETINRPVRNAIGTQPVQPAPVATPEPITVPKPVQAAPSQVVESTVAPKGVPPDRSIKIGRGQWGQVDVEFPDALHKYIYRLASGSSIADEAIASKLGVSRQEARTIAMNYRNRIIAETQGLSEGSLYKAPAYDQFTGEPPAPKLTLAQERREASNYTGKPVKVGGESGKVQGVAFGKVKVKLDSGKTVRVDSGEIQAP